MNAIKFSALMLALTFGFTAFAKEPSIIHQEITINVPIEQAWAILGPDFENAQNWASSIKHSEALNRESLNGSKCTARGCSVAGIGEIRETLLAYSPSEHSLTYVVKEGMPKMVRHASNTWQLVDLGNGKTLLKMDMKLETGGFMGWMMQGMMKMKMKKMSAQVVEEFQYYAENGKPHPRKKSA